MNDSLVHSRCAQESLLLRASVPFQFTQGMLERIKQAFFEQRVPQEERQNYRVTKIEPIDRSRAFMGVDYADMPEHMGVHKDISDPHLQFFRFSRPGVFCVYELERGKEVHKVYMREVCRIEHERAFGNRHLDLWHRPLCTFFVRKDMIHCGAYIIVFTAFSFGVYDPDSNCAVDNAICERIETIERQEIPVAA